MNVLVVYDSVFGNTEKVAREIGRALESGATVKTLLVTEVDADQLSGVQLLVTGSPTRAFRPTQGIGGWLKNLPPGSLQGVTVAAFDTRIAAQDISSPVLRFLVSAMGYAAKSIAKRLEKAGGKLAAPPEGFAVEGTEGPLKQGELERAAEWAKRLQR